MIRKRLIRALTAGGLSLSLATAMLATPLITVAATPNWTGSLETLPPVIEPGYGAGYEATITNNGPSNIPALFVSVVFSEPYVADENTGQTAQFVALSKDGVLLEGACGEQQPQEPLSCTVGTLNSGSSATLIVGFETSGTADAGVTVDWTTVGIGSPGGSDNSRGDALHQIFDYDPATPAARPTQISTGQDIGGGFVLNLPNEVDNAPIAGSANQIQTTIFAPAKNIAITVADEGSVVDDPGCPDGFTCVLGTSQLVVGNGSTEYGLFKVVITIDKTLLAGVNVNKVSILHVLDDLTVQELPKERFCDGSAECFSVGNIRGGHAQFTIYLAQNGYIKYH